MRTKTSAQNPNPWYYEVRSILEPIPRQQIGEYQENGITVKVYQPGYGFDYWPQKTASMRDAK